LCSAISRGYACPIFEIFNLFKYPAACNLEVNTGAALVEVEVLKLRANLEDLTERKMDKIKLNPGRARAPRPIPT